MKITPSTCLVIILLLFLISPFVSLAQSQVVGVKAGDWVKYRVLPLMGETIWGDLYDRAVWFKVEVLNVIGTNVSVLETRHRQNREENVELISWDLVRPDPAPKHLNPPLIIPANVGPGYAVGRMDVWVAHGSPWVNVELKLNYSSLQSYCGVTREVNVLEFSFCLPYFEYIANFSVRIMWDKETGFLLERTDKRAFLGYETADIVKLEITDTNIFEMKSSPPSSWQRLIVGVVGMVTTTALGIKALKITKIRDTIIRRRCIRNEKIIDYLKFFTLFNVCIKCSSAC